MYNRYMIIILRQSWNCSLWYSF